MRVNRFRRSNKVLKFAKMSDIGHLYTHILRKYLEITTHHLLIPTQYSEIQSKERSTFGRLASYPNKSFVRSNKKITLLVEIWAASADILQIAWVVL